MSRIGKITRLPEPVQAVDKSRQPQFACPHSLPAILSIVAVSFAVASHLSTE